MHYWKLLFNAVGPEQVSPHYESLSRSRRGIIFLYAYTSTIVVISQLGGNSIPNDWLSAMIFNHEFLISFIICNSETRSWAWSPGAKFTIFYNTFIRYEYAQLCTQWCDNVEEAQNVHLIPTKEQMEYMRINNEYDYVKKRALVNYLSNSRNDLERHFHNRANNMLSSIERFEGNNLRDLLNSISTDAVSKVNEAIESPEHREEILEKSFESALIGIRAGKMEYVNDPILPILTDEINRRSNEFKGLSAAEESKLLSLNDDQKRIISDNDKKAKAEFLTTAPSINNPGVKMNEKFKGYVQSVGGSAH